MTAIAVMTFVYVCCSPALQETPVSTAMRKVLQLVGGKSKPAKAANKASKKVDSKQKQITSFFVKK
jgi:hypothetical protein